LGGCYRLPTQFTTRESQTNFLTSPRYSYTNHHQDYSSQHRKSLCKHLWCTSNMSPTTNLLCIHFNRLYLFVSAYFLDFGSPSPMPPIVPIETHPPFSNQSTSSHHNSSRSGATWLLEGAFPLCLPYNCRVIFFSLSCKKLSSFILHPCSLIGSPKVIIVNIHVL
jgi:hypothetical protein